MRNNYKKYHESIAMEFEASRNRVRYFIEDNHHGEDGRYKEILLMNYLRKVLPSNVSVGTGFVKNSTVITSQIDLIIYNNSIPTLFSEGDFVVVLPESVYGIIEVKSKLRAGRSCRETIEKADENGVKIGREIFNGIFSYELGFGISNVGTLPDSLREALKNSSGLINHISLGPDIFIKYWDEGNPDEFESESSFSFYKIRNLSFGYFISNLIETIYRKSGLGNIESNLREFLYPKEERKESGRLRDLEVIRNVPIPRRRS